jgi:hypothetical protein
LLCFETHGSKDYVLPACALLVAPSFDQSGPRLRLFVLSLQDLPSGGEHGAGTDAKRGGGLRYVLGVTSKQSEGGVRVLLGGWFHNATLMQLAFAYGQQPITDQRFAEHGRTHEHTTAHTSSYAAPAWASGTIFRSPRTAGKMFQ